MKAEVAVVAIFGGIVAVMAPLLMKYLRLFLAVDSASIEDPLVNEDHDQGVYIFEILGALREALPGISIQETYQNHQVKNNLPNFYFCRFNKKNLVSGISILKNQVKIFKVVISTCHLSTKTIVDFHFQGTTELDLSAFSEDLIEASKISYKKVTYYFDSCNPPASYVQTIPIGTETQIFTYGLATTSSALSCSRSHPKILEEPYIPSKSFRGLIFADAILGLAFFQKLECENSKNMFRKHYILVANSSCCTAEQSICDRHSISLIPQGYSVLGDLITIDERPDRRPQNRVLIDDDPLIHELWSLASNNGQTKFVGFFCPQSFLSCAYQFCTSTEIFLDANLSRNIKGELYGKILWERGFDHIYFNSGYSLGDREEAEEIHLRKYFKGISEKTVPWGQGSDLEVKNTSDNLNLKERLC